MEKEYKQPIGETTEHAPDVPEETSADTSEIKEALNIILGEEAIKTTGKKARARPYSLTERALVFRKKLDLIEAEMEASDES